MSYANGSDMLLLLGEKALGHCTSHTTTLASETKERAVKPLATAQPAAQKFKEKTVIGQSISISGEGLIYDGETEAGYAELFKLWKAGEPVKAKCMMRGSAKKAYLVCDCIITSLERTDPANDDASYSIELENAAAPETMDESAFTASDAF